MNITETCEMLRKELYHTGYVYGFLLNGVKHVPDSSKGFDKDFYQLSTQSYQIQAIEDTKREKIGTCLDAVLVMRDLLDEHSIPNKIWMIYNKVKHKVHAILTFYLENKVVYLELTPQSGKQCYGKEVLYENEQDFINDYQNNDYEIVDITAHVTPGTKPNFFLECLN